MRTPRLAWSIGALPTRGVSRAQIAFLAVAALAASLVVVAPPLPSVPASSGAAAEARALEGYGKLPISFEPNVGQAPNRYDFVARGQGFGMAINATGASLALGTEDIVRLNLVGANRSAHPRALESLPGVVNYFIGNDTSKWRSDVSTFGRVSYREILPGIDVTYYGTNAGTLEYDFVVAPGADPTDIRVGFSSASDVALRDGSLVITTASGALTQEAPVLYQNIAGRRVPVEGRFSLVGDVVGFEVGNYDHHHPLVIDPTLIYSTYLGGAGDDIGYAIAVDALGQAYVTGSTTSTSFPTQGPFQGTNGGGGGGGDVFVTKLDATGSVLIYSTYIGGADEDVAQGIALDGSGSAYVTGWTFSTNFPTQAALQGIKAGGNDIFVTKLTAAGSGLVYSTYLGGQLDDLAKDIAVDSSGAAYVTGGTDSTDYPTVVPYLGTYAGGFNDAFVTKLNAPGSALIYSTYLGGSNDDYGWGIAVDGSGQAFVTGDTFSTDFPTQAPPPGLGSNAGSSDAFVTKLTATGSGLIYSTYLGGLNDDSARGGIAIDSSGAAYVAGYTSSPNFPTLTPLPGQGFNATGPDAAFVSKLNSGGSALSYSTFLGGSDSDEAHGITVDGSGAAYVTGFTYSLDFPMVAPAQGTYAGSQDAFVTKLNIGGSTFSYSTFLGGSSFDHGHGVAVDSSGATYVAGDTFSTDFPLQGPYQGANAGSDDVFVTKLGTPVSTCGGQAVTIQVTSPTTLGTQGNDVINGTSGIDTIDGLGGDDIICGLGGNDKLNGSKHNDKVFGDAGNDTITGDVGNDKLNGGNGTDNLNGNDGVDTLNGGDGNDTINGSAGSDTLNGNNGADQLHGGDGADALDGGDGSDTLNGNANNDNLFGGLGADTLSGGLGNDTLNGAAGNDYLYGQDGTDSLYGTAGNDTLYGIAGNDFLSGGAGSDYLSGGNGADTLNGNADSDKLYGNDGNDSLNGGPGTNYCDGGAPPVGDTGTLCQTSINIP